MDTRRSVWAELTFFRIILCWLIIPIVVAVVVAINYRVSITEKSINVKSGVFSVSKHEYAVAGITEINIYQSFFGRIFNYGTLNISLAGNKNVSLREIIAPNNVKEFIEAKLEKTADSLHMFVN